MRGLSSHFSLGLIPILILLGNLTACGGGPSASAFLGIYQVTSWTQTEESCDGEAVDVLEEKTQSNPLVLVDACSFNFPGAPSGAWINVIACSDEDDCNDEKCEGNNIRFALGPFGMVAKGSDEEGWTNDPIHSAGISNQDPLECFIKAWFPRLFQNEDGVLTYEQRLYEGKFDPINGSCFSSSFEDGESVEHFDDSELSDIAKDTEKTGVCVEHRVVTLGPLNPDE